MKCSFLGPVRSHDMSDQLMLRPREETRFLECEDTGFLGGVVDDFHVARVIEVFGSCHQVAHPGGGFCDREVVVCFREVDMDRSVWNQFLD